MPGFGSDGLRGKSEISSMPLSTRSSIKTLSFPTAFGVTVKMVVDLIASSGRQNYQFTPEWEGRRYWNKVLIEDLQAAGYIQRGSATEAEDTLAYYWVSLTGKGKRTII